MGSITSTVYLLFENGQFACLIRDGLCTHLTIWPDCGCKREAPGVSKIQNGNMIISLPDAFSLARVCHFWSDGGEIMGLLQ